MPRGIPNAKRDETGMRYATFNVPLPYVVEADLCTQASCIALVSIPSTLAPRTSNRNRRLSGLGMLRERAKRLNWTKVRRTKGEHHLTLHPVILLDSKTGAALKSLLYIQVLVSLA